MTDLKNVAQLNPVHAIILVIVSTVLTMLGGHLPARMAAKKTLLSLCVQNKAIRFFQLLQRVVTKLLSPPFFE